jgi:F-type H+-transporting ATPase subunit delta
LAVTKAVHVPTPGTTAASTKSRNQGLSANSATASGLASRYATALFELAVESNELDAVAADLDKVGDLLRESPDFARMIRSPIVSRDDQGKGVAAVAGQAGIGKLVQSFLGVLAKQRRLTALPQMTAAFGAMLAERRGEVAAELVSAVPLSDKDLAGIKTGIERYAGKKVRLSSSVDESLIGGLVVKVGSKMIDASLKTKLHQLELSMKGIG